MVAYDYVIMNSGYVHIIKQQYVDELREKLRKYNIFTIGRYGGWTYNSMEVAQFNRVQFDAVRSESGLNRFIMAPIKWIVAIANTVLLS